MVSIEAGIVSDRTSVAARDGPTHPMSGKPSALGSRTIVVVSVPPSPERDTGLVGTGTATRPGSIIR